jgi:hypothetical protein
MKSLFASVVAVVLWCVVSSSLYAQQQLPSPEAARDLAERVMQRVAKDDIEGGLATLKPYWLMGPGEFDAIAEKVKLQLPLLRQRFGKAIGYEFIRDEKVGTSLHQFTYLQRFEKHATRWVFIFYRGEKDWLLNSFWFDDNTRALFQ